MSVIDELVSKRASDSTRVSAPLSAKPQRHLAILTCMDARINLEGALGLRQGDAHIIRNAGGLASEDAVRSIMVSQQLLETTSLMVIQHTRCGLQITNDSTLHADLEEKLSSPIPFSLGSFHDLTANVKLTLSQLQACPLLSYEELRGFIYDVDTHSLHEVAS